MRQESYTGRDFLYLATIGVILTSCGVSRLFYLVPIDPFWSGFFVTAIGISFIAVAVLSRSEPAIVPEKRSYYSNADKPNYGYKTELQLLKEKRGYIKNRPEY